MRRLGRQIAVFLVPLFIIWLGLEWFYRSTPNNYTFKRQMVINAYDDTEVLILGSSHAFFGLNPDYFNQKAINLSNISQSLYFDELLLARHLDSLKSLKAVVVPVGYFSLSQKDNGLEDRWRKYFYKEQMGLEVPSVSTIDPRQYSLALSRRLNRSIDLIRTYLEKETLVSCHPNGYGKQDSSDILNDKAAISVIIAKKHEDGSLDFRANTRRLARMIELCKERNVAFIPVIMPVYPDYYHLLNDDKWSKIKATLDSLDAANANTFFVDLSQDERFEKNDLRDADHLTNQGASKCSQILSSYINELNENWP